MIKIIAVVSLFLAQTSGNDLWLLKATNYLVSVGCTGEAKRKDYQNHSFLYTKTDDGKYLVLVFSSDEAAKIYLETESVKPHRDALFVYREIVVSKSSSENWSEQFKAQLIKSYRILSTGKP